MLHQYKPIVLETTFPISLILLPFPSVNMPVADQSCWIFVHLQGRQKYHQSLGRDWRFAWNHCTVELCHSSLSREPGLPIHSNQIWSRCRHFATWSNQSQRLVAEHMALVLLCRTLVGWFPSGSALLWWSLTDRYLLRKHHYTYWGSLVIGLTHCFPI